MGSQGHLPGTLPSAAKARRQLLKAVNEERTAEELLASQSAVLKDLRAAVKAAAKKRRSCEDVMNEIEVQTDGKERAQGDGVGDWHD
jgi:hypothetical protein